MVLEGYMTKRSMTLRAKLTILVPVTALLAVGFAMMSNVPVGRAIVAIVWVGHIVYFGFIVKLRDNQSVCTRQLRDSRCVGSSGAASRLAFSALWTASAWPALAPSGSPCGASAPLIASVLGSSPIAFFLFFFAGVAPHCACALVP